MRPVRPRLSRAWRRWSRGLLQVRGDGLWKDRQEETIDRRRWRRRADAPPLRALRRLSSRSERCSAALQQRPCVRCRYHQPRLQHTPLLAKMMARSRMSYPSTSQARRRAAAAAVAPAPATCASCARCSSRPRRSRSSCGASATRRCRRPPRPRRPPPRPSTARCTSRARCARPTRRSRHPRAERSWEGCVAGVSSDSYSFLPVILFR